MRQGESTRWQIKVSLQNLYASVRIRSAPPTTPSESLNYILPSRLALIGFGNTWKRYCLSLRLQTKTSSSTMTVRS